MIIYFMRHAESATNPYDSQIISGSNFDTPLSENGQTSLQELTAQLIVPSRSEHLAHVYVSPARRCQETFDILQAIPFIRAAPMTISPELRELSQGIAEGEQRSKIQTPEIVRQQKSLGKAFAYQNGESINDAANRMKHWVHSILPRYAENDAILVISHAMLIRSYISTINDWSFSETIQSKLGNCHVVTVKASQDPHKRPEILGFNQTLLEAW